jgi:aminoglycoside phosphotransferase (APT) family kinase protein
LSPSVAQTILASIAPRFRVTSVVVRAGGEVNAVYEVRGADAVRPLIVKVYPERLSTSERWRSKLLKEVFVYRLLARHGIREVPRVLCQQPAGAPGLPAAYAVMTMLDGRPLSLVGDHLTNHHTDEVYQTMGRLLAAVHRLTADRWGYVTTRIVDAKPSNTAYMLDQFATKLSRFGDLGGGPRLTKAIERHVARHASLFAACRRPVLCHNDFHGGNVVVAQTGQNWRVSGYIDMEGVIVADPLLDLAKTDYYALRHHPTRRHAFLRGYGLLPPDWVARTALYRLHHAVEFWNWSASGGKRVLLPGIEADIEELISEP